jgi:hypothetical protein
MAAPGTGAWAKFPTPELEKMANDPSRPERECDEILAEIGRRLEEELRHPGMGSPPPGAPPPPPRSAPPPPRTTPPPRQQGHPQGGWGAPPTAPPGAAWAGTAPAAGGPSAPAPRRSGLRRLKIRFVVAAIVGFFLLVSVVGYLASGTGSTGGQQLATTCDTPQGSCTLVAAVPVGDDCVCSGSFGSFSGTAH